MTLAIVIGYFVVCILLGIYMERRAKAKAENSAEAFATGKNSLGVLAAFGLMVGNIVGGTYITGIPGGVVRLSLGYNWAILGYVVGWALIFLFTNFYRTANYKFGAATVGETFRCFFSPRCQKVMSLAIILSFGATVSTSFIAIATVFKQLFQLSNTASYVISIAMIIVLALMGGLGGLARLNVVHMAVFFIAAISIVLAGMGKVPGGFSTAYAAFAEAGHARFSDAYFNSSYIIAALLSLPFATFVSALPVSGLISAKDAKTAKRAAIMLPVAALLVLFLLSLMGIIGFGFGIEGGNTLSYRLAETLGPIYPALLAIAVIAATLSTATTMILFISSALVREFIFVNKPDVSDKTKLLWIRICIVVLGTGFMLLGLLSDDLITIIGYAGTLFSVLGICITAFLVWKKPNEKALFWSMLTGVIVCAVWAFAFFFVKGGNLFGLTPTMACVIASFASIIIFTLLFSKDKESKEYLAYKSYRDEFLAAQKEGKA
jgi:Na+/proline symporter